MAEDKLKILIVEDSEADYRLVFELLKECTRPSFEVAHARELSGALEEIRGARYSAVLLDLNLPDSRGLPAIDKLLAVDPGLPIVVLTGLDDPEVSIEALHKKAQDYLVKGNLGADILCRSVRYAIERKRVEEALLQTSEQRRLALEAGDLGTWEYRFDLGEVFWDDRCRGMFGVAAGDQIRYAEALNRVHPNDREGVDKAVKEAMAGANDGAYHREFRVIWPDASAHWVDSHGRVYFGGEGQNRRAVRFIGVIQEVTARREAEKKHSTVLETNQSGFWMSDLDGKLLEVNEAYAYMSGYSREELLRMQVGDLEARETQEEIRRHIQLVRERGHHQFESRHRRKDGTLFDVDIRATYLDIEGGRVVVFSWDITNRIKAEKALLQAKEEWERTFDSVPDLIAILDNNHRIVRANRAMAERLGMTPGQCVDQIVSRACMA